MRAESGARVRVSSTSATKVHSMPGGGASVRTRIVVDDAACLEYVPQPVILQSGCELSQATEIVAGESAACSSPRSCHSAG